MNGNLATVLSPNCHSAVQTQIETQKESKAYRMYNLEQSAERLDRLFRLFIAWQSDILHEYFLLTRRFHFRILGKYRPGHPSSVNDPKTWKANFRCAINSLPDVVEVKEMNVNSKRGPNAYKVYTFLPPKSRKRAKRKCFVQLFTIKRSNNVMLASRPFDM